MLTSLNETLAMLAQHGASHAKFSENGALLEVNFFSARSAVDEREHDTEPPPTETEAAALRLATRGMRRVAGEE